MTERLYQYSDFDIDFPHGAGGENVRAKCPKCGPNRKPEHRNEKDLVINATKGEWHCKHCMKAGSLRRGWFDDPPPPGGTVPRSAAPAAAPAPKAEPKLTAIPVATPEAQAFVEKWALDERGIPAEVVRRYRLYGTRRWYGQLPQGEQEQPSVAIPYFVGGTHVHTKYRTLKADAAGKKHFTTDKGTPRPWYGLDDVRGQAQVVAVEGEFDKLAFATAGVTACVSVPDGAPSPEAERYESKFAFMDDPASQAAFAKAKKIVLAVDADAAGRKLQDELARRLGFERTWILDWPDGIKDANDYLRAHGPDALRAYLNDAAVRYPVDGLFRVSDRRLAIRDRYTYGRPPALSTGWPKMDPVYRIAPGLVTFVVGVPGAGKALALDTPIPTPRGWTTQGDLRPGDAVYDETGKPCAVVGVTETWHDRTCYRVRFSDGTSVVADAAHEWLTWTEAARRSERNAGRIGRGGADPRPARKGDQAWKRARPGVVTTEEIAETLVVRGKSNHSIPFAGAIEAPAADLPIDPYVFGIWLGDGETRNGAITTADPEVLDAARAAGYEPTKWSGKYRWGLRGLTAGIRAAGVYGRKHVPVEYLRASADQRRAVLAGIVDSDGHLMPDGRAEVTVTKQVFAAGTLELARSLGFAATLSEDRARIDGRDCGPRYRVRFTPWGLPLRIARKAERQQATPGPRNRHRYIVGCDPVESVPVLCIQVDSPSHLYLAGEAMVPTHNSHWLNALVTNLMAYYGWRIGVCSPEWQPIEDHMIAMQSLLVGKPFDAEDALAAGVERMSPQEAEWAQEWLDERAAWILPETVTIAGIIERVKVAIATQGVKGVIIDPWSEIETSGERPRGLSTTEWIGESIRALRKFARAYQVHVWLVIHPTKLELDAEGEWPIPDIYDAAGSANWANMADHTIVVWRSNKEEARASGEVQIISRKTRFKHTGRAGEGVTLWFDPATGRYSDAPGGAPKGWLAAPWEEQPEEERTHA